ncbi:MAG: ATP-binding protein [Planctomycetaceae bacterium]
MNVTLRDQLKQLRLSGLSESLEVRLHEAQSAKLDYAEFLELILQDELVIREDRQIARRIKAAAFRDQKSLDDFDFAFNPSVMPFEERMEQLTAKLKSQFQESAKLEKAILKNLASLGFTGKDSP